MKLIEWNCQGAFRLKNKRILTYNPDILIIPECENYDKLEFERLTPRPNDFLWFGDSKTKGIGIFSYSDYRFELHRAFNPKYRYVLPIIVTRPNETFLLFAIWAMDNKEKPDARYIGQIWLAINYYSSMLNIDSIIIGDFNSNQIWDYKERVGNHSDVVDFLNNRQIFSLYHQLISCQHGKEECSTFYLQRNKNKPYHIDYCFCSNKIFKNGYDLTIGNFDDWIDMSDHMPMIVNIHGTLNFNKIDNTLTKFFHNKLQEFHAITLDKFSDLISDLINTANESDKLENTKEQINERKPIIEKFEKLIALDKLTK